MLPRILYRAFYHFIGLDPHQDPALQDRLLENVNIDHLYLSRQIYISYRYTNLLIVQPSPEHHQFRTP